MVASRVLPLLLTYVLACSLSTTEIRVVTTSCAELVPLPGLPVTVDACVGHEAELVLLVRGAVEGSPVAIPGIPRVPIFRDGVLLGYVPRHVAPGIDVQLQRDAGAR